MDIVNHTLCTKTLAAPADMPDCSELPVAEITDESGIWSISFWKPSAEEIATLVAGGNIALWVNAQDDDHPVVGLSVTEAERKAQNKEIRNEQNIYRSKDSKDDR